MDNIRGENTARAHVYVHCICICHISIWFYRLLPQIPHGLSDWYSFDLTASLSTQIYFIHTYASYEITILSLMAYDCYVAICDLLHNHLKVSPRKVWRLAAVAWISPASSVAIYLYLSSFVWQQNIQKVYCTIWNIATLSCVPTFTNNVVGLLVTVITKISLKALLNSGFLLSVIPLLHFVTFPKVALMWKC